MNQGNKEKSIDKTELVWPGKRKEVERVELPFQTIETINLPRGRRQKGIFDSPKQSKLLKEAEQKVLSGSPNAEWKNRLIWGDNLLVMGSLLKEFAGKINLIYIDPPFATGDDFSFTINIGDQAEVTKEPSALEVKAYRDTWGKGMQSYLQMMYDRLVLMKELLADDGSIYVHLGWQVAPYVKVLMDEIFGEVHFRNEIIWRRSAGHSDANQFGRNHDSIFFYSKSDKYHFNAQYPERSEEDVVKNYPLVDGKGRRYLWDNMAAAGSGPARKFGDKILDPPRGQHWRFSQKNIDRLMKDGRIKFNKSGVPRVQKYADSTKGMPYQDIWTDAIVHISTKTGYPTEKSEKLIRRVVRASSKLGDLIADFFCGSGTTGVVAEQLGRRWIMADLGRFAIHTTRKRLLDKSAKPFVVQNLGKYERHRWAKLNGKYKDYIKFILELYHAEQVDGFTHLHGKKDKSFVRVGSVDAPVTLSEIRETLQECKENKIKKLDVLGWEWEMGLHDLIKEEAEKYGVKLGTFQIPREVMELSIADAQKRDVQFFELAYLEVEAKTKDKRAEIELKDFIIPNPELLPEEVKGKVKNWSDFVDYWAVDWDFNGDSFHNMNQRYRTRKEPKLELSMYHDYKKSGKYNVLVKVIDIFGNDTTKLIEVKI